VNASSKIKEGLVLPSFPLSSSLSKRFARSDVATTTFCEWFFYRRYAIKEGGELLMTSCVREYGKLVSFVL